jgi:hypothetical protein
MFPMLEVNFVKGDAAATPYCRRAAELPARCLVQRSMTLSVDNLRIAQLLQARIERPTAAFQQDDVQAAPRKFQRQNNSGGSRTHDANVALKRRTWGQIFSV